MKPFTTLACLLLAAIAALQLTRAVLGWEVIVNGVTIAPWISFIAAGIAGGLALMTWREHR
ncbi:hypothetical protein [Lysobacter fragariae]